MRRATHSFLKLFCVLSISIHALREESDARTDDNRKSLTISIHALREESDLAFCTSYKQQPLFQSTLSVRRATKMWKSLSQYVLIFQSTLSVRRATNDEVYQVRQRFISIHALREESDTKRTKALKATNGFQSTLSVRRATKHFLHFAQQLGDFNPRSP